MQLDCRRALTELSLEVEPVARAAAADGLAHQLEEAFRSALNLRVPVQVLPKGSLPRFEMKARRWIKTVN